MSRGGWQGLPAIVCGRRFCSTCKRWRHQYEFGVAKWDHPHVREKPLQLRNDCHTCERIKGRIKQAKRRGHKKPFKAKQWKPKMTEEERIESRRKRQKKRYRKMRRDPERLARWREYQRDYQEKLRRERGVPIRNFKDKGAVLPVDTSDTVDATEFFDWLDEWLEEHRKRDFVSIGNESKYMSATELFKKAHVNGSYIKDCRQKNVISIEAVDRVLTAAGDEYMLPILYPVNLDAAA